MQFTFFHIKSNLMLCHVCCSLPHYLSLISMLFLTFKVGTCEVIQSCPTLCDPMDYSLTGSSVHGIFKARILEWVAISFSRGSSRPRDRTQVSRIAGRRFTVWATREGPQTFSYATKLNHSLFPKHCIDSPSIFLYSRESTNLPKPTSPNFTIFQAQSQMSHSSYNEQKFSLCPFPVFWKNVSIFC